MKYVEHKTLVLLRSTVSPSGDLTYNVVCYVSLNFKSTRYAVPVSPIL